MDLSRPLLYLMAQIFYLPAQGVERVVLQNLQPLVWRHGRPVPALGESPNPRPLIISEPSTLWQVLKLGESLILRLLTTSGPWNHQQVGAREEFLLIRRIRQQNFA